MALYAFLWQLISHVFTYMAITYVYFIVQQHHSIQNEMVILRMHRYITNYKIIKANL